MSLRLGYDALEEFTPEVTASVKRPVELASSLGIRVERIRVRSPRPIRALIQLVTERGVGLLVFGPDRVADVGSVLSTGGRRASGGRGVPGLGGSGSRLDVTRPARRHRPARSTACMGILHTGARD